MLKTSKFEEFPAGPISSPEALLLLRVADRAIKDYWCWRWKEGPIVAIREGCFVREWVNKRNGTFPLVAFAAGYGAERFRRLFLGVLDNVDKGIMPNNLAISAKRAKR